MNRSKLFTVACAASLMAACSSGDINLSPQTNVSNSNNTVTTGGGGPNDACASFVRDGQELSGTADADGNCTYGSAFVGPQNNLTVDLVIPALPDGGVHIFTSSLFVGETFRTQADLAAAGIFEGGDGPTLTVEAGATLAFQTNADFMIINRGSRIIANGTADAPITFTSVSDALQDPTNPIDPEAVQQWGGIVINGFGISNKCEYTGTRGVDLALVGECSIEAEGSAGDDESQYGGTNDEDSSGILRYVVVKHTGATVGSGDELNGISFGGVGNGTVIENLQVYSTFDDGVEMFGGSVDITNLVALYVRDDSIDIDEGYNGTITNALVIQQEGDGNHCIESDGIGSYDSTDVAGNQDLIDRGLNSAPTINNLTCIVSANGGGTHDPGAGWLFREGIEPIVNDAVLVSSYGANDTGAGDDNYCLGITDDETHAAADGDTLQLNSVIYACQENFLGTAWGAFANEQEFAEAEGNQFATVADGTAVDASDAADPDLTLFTGTLKIQSLPWNQLAVDAAAADPNTTPTSGEATDILGGFGDMDWATGWTYGLDADNRGQALWFE